MRGAEEAAGAEDQILAEETGQSESVHHNAVGISSRHSSWSLLRECVETVLQLSHSDGCRFS